MLLCSNGKLLQALNVFGEGAAAGLLKVLQVSYRSKLPDVLQVAFELHKFKLQGSQIFPGQYVAPKACTMLWAWGDAAVLEGQGL